MENSVVSVEYSEWTRELGAVPVVVSGENGRLRLRIDAEDEGFQRLIVGETFGWKKGSGEKEAEEQL